ncbi:MAG: protein kinase [Hamadaea sp.]|nr:protein kinase [Hamadaea sp.]
MATVWRAHDEHLDRDVAIKVLANHLVEDTSSRLRLRMEAQALARLDHPHIASVHDYSVADVRGETFPFLVLELVVGSPLSVLLADGRSLSWRQAAGIAVQTASALAAAHERGLVHRDVTAANILVTADGVKLIDFGISITAGAADTDGDDLLLGTPAYIAPERLGGAPGTYASDMYSLGVILYRMLTGRPPFPATTSQDLFATGRTWSPPPLPAALNLPDTVAGLCYLCLAKDPSTRPSAADVVRGLSEYADITVAAPTAAASTRRIDAVPNAGRVGSSPNRTVQYAAALAVVVASAAVAAWNIGLWRTDAPAASVAAGPGPARVHDCAVSYQTSYDDGRTFRADITVQNTSTADMTMMVFAFDLPGDQQVQPGRTWLQDGRTVTAVTPLTMPAGGQTQLPLAGTYTRSNAYPVRFHLADRTCAVTLIGPAGVPISPSTTAGSPVPTPVQAGGGSPGSSASPASVLPASAAGSAGSTPAPSVSQDTPERPRPIPSRTSPSRSGPVLR